MNMDEHLLFQYADADPVPTNVSEDMKLLIDTLLLAPGTKNFDKLFIGMDTNVEHLCWPILKEVLDEKQIAYKICVVSPGEKHKSLQSMGIFYESFFCQGGTRQTLVVGLGGGIISNMLGFVAGTLFRGLRLVQIPTTFLSAHDAAGSSQKQAINFQGRKNAVGVFHIPKMVLINPGFFQTQTEKDIRSGFGELVKNAVILGGEHLDYIRSTIMVEPLKDVHRSTTGLKRGTLLGIQAKQSLLLHDPKEKSGAFIFEFGHTTSHAIELTMANTTHGECVAIGCVIVANISFELGLCSEATAERVAEMVTALQPELSYQAEFKEHDQAVDAIIECISGDNKKGCVPERDGFVPITLLRSIGDVFESSLCQRFLEYVPCDLVRKHVSEAIHRYVQCSR